MARKWEYAQLLTNRYNPSKGDANPESIHAWMCYPDGRSVKRAEWNTVDGKLVGKFFDANGDEFDLSGSAVFEVYLYNELGKQGWELVGEIRNHAALTQGAGYYAAVPLASKTTFKREVD